MSIKVSENSLPLSEIVYFENNKIQIDQKAIFSLPDKSPPSSQYKPSTAKLEVRKLNTQKRYKSWQKAYRELKRKNPDKSDSWCAIQIAKMDIAQGRGSETIRKKMK